MKQSYGKASKERVIRVLEAILATSVDLDHDIDCSDISKEEIYIGKNKNEIFIKTTTKNLIELVWLYEKRKGIKENPRLKGWAIRDALKHLENTLEILQDLRKRRQGSSEIFIMLKMWHEPKHIQFNINKINECWGKPQDIDITAKYSSKAGQEYNNDINTNINKFIFPDYSYKTTNIYIGREWLIDDVINILNEDAIRAVLLISELGLGKTSFLRELINRKEQLNILACYFCQRDIKHSLKTSTFVSSLITQVGEVIEEYSMFLARGNDSKVSFHDDLENDPIYALVEGLIKPLAQIQNPGKQYYILIDALDESLDTIYTQRCKNIPITLQEYLVSFPEWIKFIITTRKIPEIVSSFDRFSQIEIRAQDKRNLSDLSKYIDHHVNQLAHNNELNFDKVQLEDISKKICDYSQGNFLYAQQTIEGIKNKYYSQKNIGSLPPGLFGLYLECFNKLFENPKEFVSIKQILQILSASAEPLNKKEIIQILNLVSEEDLEKEILPIQEYLNISKGPDNNEYIRIFHQSLTDWLTSKDVIGTSFYISVRQGHESIADWCLRMIEERQLRQCSSYVEEYTPYHLINACLVNKFVDLLQKHPIYIQKSIKSIIDNCIRSQEWPIHTISDFLHKLVRTNEHFAVLIVLSISEQLLEKRQNISAQNVISLIPPDFIYFNIIQNIFKAKSCLLEANYIQAKEFLVDIFQEESIPKSIRGIAGLNLIESHKFLGDITEAKQATITLGELLNPKYEFELWMRSQCELSELEFIEGDLPNSWCRLKALQNCSNYRKSSRLLSIINYLRGEILFSVGKYSDANDAFLLSVEQSDVENLPEQVILSRICLAKTYVFLNTSEVENILNQVKNEYSESNSLYTGLIHYVEALYNLKSNVLNNALYLVNVAENIFSRLSIKVLFSQCILLKSKILFDLGQYEECCSCAYKANYYFQEKKIFPLLRKQAYEQMMISAQLLGHEDRYKNSDNPRSIKNIDNFLNLLHDDCLNKA